MKYIGKSDTGGSVFKMTSRWTLYQSANGHWYARNSNQDDLSDAGWNTESEARAAVAAADRKYQEQMAAHAARPTKPLLPRERPYSGFLDNGDDR